MAKKAYPIIYTKTTRGSLYRNGSVNPTLYFEVLPNEELMANDPQYAEYFEDMMRNEIPRAICNKFVVSSPLYITNDKIPFIMFKTNIDEYSLREFCRAILQEFSFHTGKRHEGIYGLTKTIFVEMGKNPPVFRSIMMSTPSEKLTRSPEFEKMKTPMKFEGDPLDQGIMLPYAIWKEEKRRQRAQESQDQFNEDEEVVTW
ncbi:hypothetical protein [Allobaculum stercoricanis]|uniref:hypothetical protein n=1 Tax=Allobaculum stercoricanis TaxID=174709 RepID=UPI0003742488|nr:hypothetical protein [Allobaculum stercoricanis]